MAFADAALGAAGHAVTDPRISAVRRRAIQGELTTEQAIAEALSIIRAE
ncbi:hypothetical protein [Plantibacter sp. CFBP 13570]|nr:hypothetical protein [Plantibacter sp. CFBP 13570]MBD8535681.1 hypothetical protein [Plantibacter sp. CFBP 13570]